MSSAEPDVIRLISRFGVFEAPGDSVITFPDGIPGFEECRRFVVLRDASRSPLMCLHGVDGPAAFLVVDPRDVDPAYAPALTDTDRVRLGVDSEHALLWLAVVSAGGDDRLFANLRAPIVINPQRLIGIQLVPESGRYRLRSPLPLQIARSAEEQPCSL